MEIESAHRRVLEKLTDGAPAHLAELVNGGTSAVFLKHMADAGLLAIRVKITDKGRAALARRTVA